MSERTQRFEAAIEHLDAANRQDPNTESFKGEDHPKELLYAQRMTHWLEHLAPDASEPLRLAARCQHIERWKIPRSRYPRDRVGYLRWRTELYGFHAETAGGILREVGYDEPTVERVQGLLRKQHLKTDPEMQLLEDVICLVFLESSFSDFAKEHPEEKMVGIIRKTWRKMSPRGRQMALELDLSEPDRTFIEKAVGTGADAE